MNGVRAVRLAVVGTAVASSAALTVAAGSLLVRPNHPVAPVNYLVGRRRVTVHGFARVAYGGVYPGIDVVYHGNQRRLEYDWIVRPGADPRAIELGLAGVDHLRLREDGALALVSGGIP